MSSNRTSERCAHLSVAFDSHLHIAPILLFSYLRFICKNTIEENIFKKANKKCLLGDLAIDGSSFDVEYFKKVIFFIYKSMYFVLKCVKNRTIFVIFSFNRQQWKILYVSGMNIRKN